VNTILELWGILLMKVIDFEFSKRTESQSPSCSLINLTINQPATLVGYLRNIDGGQLLDNLDSKRHCSLDEFLVNRASFKSREADER